MPHPSFRSRYNSVSDSSIRYDFLIEAPRYNVPIGGRHKHQVSRSGRLPAVRISTPVSVILHMISDVVASSNRMGAYSSVSSNCALLFPSTVVAVQLSGQCTVSQFPPRLII